MAPSPHNAMHCAIETSPFVRQETTKYNWISFTIWLAVVKSLRRRWGIWSSISLKLDYTLVRLTTSFTQAWSIPSHHGIEHITSWNRTVCFQVLNKGKIKPCFKTKSAKKHPTKSTYIVKNTVTKSGLKVEKYHIQFNYKPLKMMWI